MCISIYKLELPSPARCHDDADAAVATVEPREAMNVDSKASYLIQIKNSEQPPSSDGRGGDKIKPPGSRSSRDGRDRASSLEMAMVNSPSGVTSASPSPR